MPRRRNAAPCGRNFFSAVMLSRGVRENGNSGTPHTKQGGLNSNDVSDTPSSPTLLAAAADELEPGPAEADLDPLPSAGVDNAEAPPALAAPASLAPSSPEMCLPIWFSWSC